MTANIEDYLLRKTAVSGFAPVRLMTVMRNQTARTPLCPEQPRLNHRIALVTGGNSGIGFETCRGLLQRGAQVILASRDQSRTHAACEQLRKELGGETEVEPLVLDLTDLESVAQAARSLVQRLKGRDASAETSDGCRSGSWRSTASDRVSAETRHCSAESKSVPASSVLIN